MSGYLDTYVVNSYLKTSPFFKCWGGSAPAPEQGITGNIDTYVYVIDNRYHRRQPRSRNKYESTYRQHEIEKITMEDEKSIMLDSSAAEEENENAAAVAAAVTSNSSTCDCPNQCKPFHFLPIQQGIMITLQRHQQQRHHHHHHHPAAAAMSTSTEFLVTMDGAVPGNTTNGDATINENSTLRPTKATTTSATCRLEIHPQKDANLIQFHPNIYIPEVLLEYPDHLIKYGGGGKSV